jgi:hypothetical protein
LVEATCTQFITKCWRIVLVRRPSMRHQRFSECLHTLWWKDSCAWIVSSCHCIVRLFVYFRRMILGEKPHFTRTFWLLPYEFLVVRVLWRSLIFMSKKACPYGLWKLWQCLWA